MLLQDSIEKLVKIPGPALKQLEKQGVRTVGDLLFYFPFRYEDFSKLKKIVEVVPDEQVSVRGVIKQIKAISAFRGRINRAEAIISDESDSIKAVWFNQSYLANTFVKGDEIFLSGKASVYKGVLQFQNPIYEKMNEEFGENVHTARILPIYHLAGHLPLRTLRNLIHQALKSVNQVEEALPAEILENMRLPGIQDSIQNLHFPESENFLEMAKRRMAFEEIFGIQLAVEKHKRSLQSQKAIPVPFNKHLIQNFVESLPFPLTNGQKVAIWEILQDIEKSEPMNRLLEGDVGSGKTLVAFTAALEVLDKGHQVALLSPTEILASQHYQSAQKFFAVFPQFSLILLTSKNAFINGEKVTKKRVLEEIAHGGAQFVIGTHAALEEKVIFKSLAFIVIDEQHRFGVRQRAALKEKSSEIHPHLLSMTATPIPRTLKLTLFGDLEISQLKQKPSGRKPIITKLVPGDKRQSAYNFIADQIKNRRQCFVVTPLIEENDRLGVKAATQEKEALAKIFPRAKVGLLHGRMSASEKERVMAEFLANSIQILVTTSVIEVGVDVPNASVIVIEGAERFGLAQLHQFRGRVGRADHQSYCFLFSDSPSAAERLENFTKTQDGFVLAEIDLQIRGFGDIYGEEQSGFRRFNFFSFSDTEMASAARDWAKKILDQDPDLKKHSALKAKTEQKVIHLE